MANILLDYFFKITSIIPTPAASTAFLRQVCVVVKPKEGVTPGSITLCTTKNAVAALTDNNDVEQLFNAGMNRVYVLVAEDLDIASIIEGNNNFYTLLISSDFEDSDIVDDGGTVDAVKASVVKGSLTFTAKDAGVAGNAITVTATSGGTAGSEVVTVVGTAISIQIQAGSSSATQMKAALDAKAEAAALIDTAIASGQGATAQATFATSNLVGGADEIIDYILDVGTFEGVIGLYSSDKEFAADQAKVGKRCAFYDIDANKAKNMFFAFGKLLSNELRWANQQYIEMPFGSDVSTVGDADALFVDRVSFVIEDPQYGKRLGFFACGGEAIVAPYITKNVMIDMQSAGLAYVVANEPDYNLVQATLIEDELQKVINSYIDRSMLTAGVVRIALEQDNFVASGYINISKPRALWKFNAELRQTL